MSRRAHDRRERSRDPTQWGCDPEAGRGRTLRSWSSPRFARSPAWALGQRPARRPRVSCGDATRPRSAEPGPFWDATAARDAGAAYAVAGIRCAPDPASRVLGQRSAAPELLHAADNARFGTAPRARRRQRCWSVAIWPAAASRGSSCATTSTSSSAPSIVSSVSSAAAAVAVALGARALAPRGQRLREALEELGPIFVKFGQVLSTRPDLLPEDIAEEPWSKAEITLPVCPAR